MVSTGFSDVDSGSQILVNASRGLDLRALPERAYRNLLVVTTVQTPGRVETAVEDVGADPSDVGVIPVSGSGSSYRGPMWVADRVEPSDLTGLSMRFSDAVRYLQSGTGWVVLDNITVLLMYAPTENVYRLTSSIVSELRSREVVGLYGCVRSAMNDETYQQFRGLYDESRSL